jgi:hypothetical protein
MQDHFVYPSLLDKPQTCPKRPLHMDRAMLRLCLQAGPKELFTPRGNENSTS